MHKNKKMPLVLAMALLLTALMTACGDNTATTAPATTAATTAAATTKAATTAAAATTASAATTAAATTAATTAASAATTAATTAASATTAAAASTGDAFALQPQANLKDVAADAQKGGKFSIIGLSKLAPDLHPYPNASSYSDTWIEASNLLFGATLIVYNWTTLKYELDAAKDLKVSPDGKTFTFTLRNDLKWSDGSPITVADYQFGFDNAVKEDKDNPDYNFVGLEDLQRLVSVKSDTTAGTITMTLNEVYAPELSLNYVNQVVPVPMKVWDGKPFYDATRNPEILKPTVVSGPYMVDSYDPNGDGVFKPNPNWYRGKANFDQVILKSGSSAVVFEAVKTGQADYATKIPPQNYQQAKSEASLNLYEWTPANASFRYVEYNTKRAPMSDKAFRVAINQSIDRSVLLKLTDLGLGAPQSSFINAASPYYNKELTEYKYDMNAAKKTLADAGYKLDGDKLIGKDGKPIEVTVVYPTSSKPRELQATYLQQQLKQLGVAVKVDGKDFNAFLKQVYSAHDFDISLSNSGGGSIDPDSFRANITSDGTQNASGYSNPRLDDLFKQGAKELNQTKRKAIYDEIQKIINDDTPLFFLYNLLNYSPMNKKVMGATPNKGYYMEYNDALTRWYYKNS